MYTPTLTICIHTDTKVPLAKDCIGAETKKMVDGLKDGECLLLENVRFYKGMCVAVCACT